MNTEIEKKFDELVKEIKKETILKFIENNKTKGILTITQLELDNLLFRQRQKCAESAKFNMLKDKGKKDSYSVQIDIDSILNAKLKI